MSMILKISSSDTDARLQRLVDAGKTLNGSEQPADIAEKGNDGAHCHLTLHGEIAPAAMEASRASAMTRLLGAP